jgi:cyanate lyase
MNLALIVTRANEIASPDIPPIEPPTEPEPEPQYYTVLKAKGDTIKRLVDEAFGG